MIEYRDVDVDEVPFKHDMASDHYSSYSSTGIKGRRWDSGGRVCHTFQYIPRYLCETPGDSLRLLFQVGLPARVRSS